jgi:hypothetical protein
VLFAAIAAAPASIVQDEQMLMSFPVWPQVAEDAIQDVFPSFQPIR